MSRLCITLLFIFHCLTMSQFERYDIIILPINKISDAIYLSHSGKIKKQSMRNNKDRSVDDMGFYGKTKKHFDSDLQGNINMDFMNDSAENSADIYAEDKIIGGEEVDINLYPYNIQYGSNCAGAIISNKWMITAGHCGKKPYIRYGSKYLNKGELINVKRYIVHPMWGVPSKEHPFDYDFQLLELAQPVTFSANAHPIKIARIEDMVVGKVITVTGWGLTTENGKYSDVLRAIRIPIISKEKCQRVRFPFFRGQLTARMFCAGEPDGKKDACQGDSGGPAVANGRILGVVSFGYGCAMPGAYGVYSKIAYVRNWIVETTGLKLD